MNPANLPEKWIAGLDADAPVTDAAQRVVERRLSAVAERVKDVVKSKAEDDEAVHQLRVSTRRAEAALKCFKPWLRRRRRRAAQKTLKRLRAAAGLVRMCDVHRGLLSGEIARAAADDRIAIETALVMLDADRRTTLRDLLNVARKARRSLDDAERRWTRRAAKPADEGTGESEDNAAHSSDNTDVDSIPNLHVAGEAALRNLARSYRALAAGDLTCREHLHRLRVQGKRLRYAIEIFGATAGDSDALANISERLSDVQERLGGVNDCHEVALRLSRDAEGADAAVCPVAPRPEPTSDACASSLSSHMQSLADRFETRCNQCAAAFLEWWHDDQTAGFRALIDDLAGPQDAPAAESTPEPDPQPEPRALEVVVMPSRNGSAELASVVRSEEAHAGSRDDAGAG